MWSKDGPQGNEAGKIRHLIVPYTKGNGLDIGAGPWKAWPHFTSVDRCLEQQGITWDVGVLHDATSLPMFNNRSLDFVFSSHCLEHIENYKATLKEWWRVIAVGGHLILYLPDKDLYGGSNDEHHHEFTQEDIIKSMGYVGGWDLVVNQQRSERDEYSFFQVYRKRGDKKHRHPWKDYVKPDKTALVIRYGGIGDMIQTASVLPHLKAQGYHVTLASHPNGEEMLRHDPYVDAFWVQNPNQVPNRELGDYWTALSHEFDRVINMSESVEVTLLGVVGNRTHALSKEARHLLMNANYLEFMHAIAKVPYEPKAWFHPSSIEQSTRLVFRKKMGECPVVVWSLAGSSVHKAWPWVDQVTVWLLENTNAKVLFMGDKLSQILEAAVAQMAAKHFLDISFADTNEMKLSEVLLKLKEHFGENRILCKSGQWNIRESLAFAQIADVVVGPETGVLNAVAFERVPKVVMLSHSTNKNLTRDWTNTAVLLPQNTDCYPCHRIHYDRSFCFMDEETGASKCAASIKPQLVYEAVIEAITTKQKEAAE